MSIIIRKALARDLESLAAFHGSFMDYHIKRDRRFRLKKGVRKTWASWLASDIKNPKTLVLIAECGGQPIACSYTMIRPGTHDYGAREVGYLCDVFVDERHRRKGIAKKLLAESKRWLRRKGVRTLQTSWASRNRVAASTWKGLGFVELSTFAEMRI